MSESNKNIAVVSGDGKDLVISPVETHISKPKIEEKKDKKIIIPKGEKN